MAIPTPNIAHNAAIVGDTLHNISLNYKWRQIVGGQLSRLLHRQYWDGTEAEIDTALNQLHDLIHDLYTSEIETMGAIVKTAQRTTNQAVAALTDTAIQWNVGDYHGGGASGDTILAPIDGVAIITAWLQFQFAVSNQVTAWLLVNGAEYSRQDADGNRQFHMRQLSFVVPVLNQDTILVIVRANAAGTIVQASGNTRIHIAFLPTE